MSPKRNGIINLRCREYMNSAPFGFDIIRERLCFGDLNSMALNWNWSFEFWNHCLYILQIEFHIELENSNLNAHTHLHSLSHTYTPVTHQNELCHFLDCSKCNEKFLGTLCASHDGMRKPWDKVHVMGLFGASLFHAWCTSCAPDISQM